MGTAHKQQSQPVSDPPGAPFSVENDSTMSNMPVANMLLANMLWPFVFKIDLCLSNHDAYQSDCILKLGWMATIQISLD